MPRDEHRGSAARTSRAAKSDHKGDHEIDLDEAAPTTPEAETLDTETTPDTETPDTETPDTETPAGTGSEDADGTDAADMDADDEDAADNPADDSDDDDLDSTLGKKAVAALRQRDEMLERGPLHLRFLGRSHVGLVRKNNQDSGYASSTLLLVADGMGGAAAGDLASAVAVSAAQEDDHLVLGEEMLDELSETIRRANNKIADLVAADHSLEGMGTTVSGGYFDGKYLGVCHIGDSRIYLIRENEITRLTHDHSWVQSLVDEGKITEEEAAFHPHRSLILKVLNGHPTNTPDCSMIELKVGDRLVLCSDGLCGLVDDEEILGLSQETDMKIALDDLIEAALQAGGLDNVTVIVAEVSDTETAQEPIILGSATQTEIPESATAVAVDLGDDDPSHEVHDPTADVIPRAPAPLADGSAAPSDAAEEERYAPTAPPKRAWLRRLIAIVVAVAAIAGLTIGGYQWTQTQYYVGAAGGQVAIYQGMPLNIVGIPLSSVYEVQQIPLADLPSFRRNQVEATIAANSLADAKVTVAELQQMAERCRASRSNPQPPASPTTSTTPTDSTTPAPPDPGEDTIGPNPGQTGSGAPSNSTPSTGTPSTGASTPGASPTPSVTPPASPGAGTEECS